MGRRWLDAASLVRYSQYQIDGNDRSVVGSRCPGEVQKPEGCLMLTHFAQPLPRKMTFDIHVPICA